MAWDDAVLVGVIARTHGNRGEVIVNAETDFPEERFEPGAQLMTRRKDGTPSTLEVDTMRMHQGRPVILFKGVASMNDAELLAGMELRIPDAEGDRERLGEGEYYHRDLIGCAVVTDGGEAIGQVVRVDGDGHATRLIVRGRRSELMIPLAEAICTVDVAAKVITVRPPEEIGRAHV